MKIRSSSRQATAWALALLLCGAGTHTALAADGTTTHTVTISATSFPTTALKVKRGDTVVWINKDPFPHTVTAAGDFDSGSIPAGGSWKHVFTKAGNHAYVCTFHPNMKGLVSVE
ncbi:MAG: plastocyanin/azurin family copper-binding protein [Caldimonas sp.]